MSKVLTCCRAVFQAGGLIVVLVEVFRKNFLASIVPVIVNAILNHHHVIVDIVAFVSKGDFPRSRLGEKQRGKILASWVTRKIRTIAQFGIRDPEGGLSLGDDDGVKNGSGRRISSMSGGQQHTMSMSALQQRSSMPRASTTLSQEYVSELPAQRYQESIPELPAQEFETGDDAIYEMPDNLTSRSDDTPTEARPGDGSTGTATWSNHSRQVSAELSSALDYSPIDARGPFSNDTTLEGYGSVDPSQPENIEEIPLPLQPSSRDGPFNGGAGAGFGNRPHPGGMAAGKEAYLPAADYDGAAYGRASHDGGAMADEEWRKEAGMYVNFTGSGPGSLEYGR
ncbi:MAG: hypothetical protein INR71_01900 [Terriglobus roseus]|nr:hypothetical protein [Terriglobus roseus]